MGERPPLQRPVVLANVTFYVKRTRPNAVDRLGRTTYRATLRVDLLILTYSFTSTCGYVGADATSSPLITLATAHPRLQPA